MRIFEEKKRSKKSKPVDGGSGSARVGVRGKRNQGKNFRWVVPRLDPAVWSRKEAYKAQLLDRLLSSKTARKGVRYYSLAVESHADGSPHLDLLLVFQKKVALTCTELDFLCQKHGDLTRYRTLNHAILTYGSKEDRPLTNMGSDIKAIVAREKFKKDPYLRLQEEMLSNPFHFQMSQYCARNDFFRDLPNFKSIQSRLKAHQAAVCNLELKRRTGFQRITGALISEVLTREELVQFHSWQGYQVIVDYINSMGDYGCVRPFKSRQLFLVGPPNSGKTTLNRALGEQMATYEVGMVKWFPAYRDGVYEFLSWNEFSLRVMPYPSLLKFLQGSPVNLEQKGGSVLRMDNQLIIMNSNFTVLEHLKQKFGDVRKIGMLMMNIENLKARIHEVIIPEGRTLFLLLKLLRKRSAI